MKKKAARKPAKAHTPAPTAMRKGVGLSSGKNAPAVVAESELLSDLRSLIQSARQRIASVANATTTFLCWNVGRRLLRENLEAGNEATQGPSSLPRSPSCAMPVGYSDADMANVFFTGKREQFFRP